MALQLDSDQMNSINTLVDRLESGDSSVLDPSGPLRDAARALFDLVGCTADRYPALHAAFDGGQAEPSDADAHVVDLGCAASGHATSRSWIGAPGLPLISGAATLVLDADTRLPLAVGASTVLGEGLTEVATDPGTAAPAAKRQTALTVHYSLDDTGATRLGATTRTVAVTDEPITANVTDPAISVQGHTSIVIGLGRPTGYNPDCDYIFYEDAPVNDPNLLVPFTGSCKLPYAITGIGSDGRISGLEITSLIYVQLSTGMPSYPLLPESLPIGCYCEQGDDYTIHWSFPYQDPQEPIVYTATSGALDTQSAFLFQFTVPVDDPSSPLVFAVCSTGTPGESVVCTKIPNLQFTWHCVAAGTLVTLADGSTAKIEDTTNRMRARTGAGGDLAIEGNWHGRHEGEALTLVTDAGHELTLTPHHPVHTPSGLVHAKDLKVGDAVSTDGGTARLASVSSSPSAASFWNLMLGDEADRAAGASLSASTFVANGIVVGDFDALGRQYRSARRDLAYMKARIPEALHTDYASAIADAA